VGVNACIPKSPVETFDLASRKMLLGIQINVVRCVGIVNRIDLMQLLSEPHQKVLRFDIPMNKSLVVEVLDVTQHMVSDHQDSLEAECSFADIEIVLESIAEQVCHEKIEVLIEPIPVKVGYTYSSLNAFKNCAFVHDKWSLG